MSIAAKAAWNSVGCSRVEKTCSVCGKVFFMDASEHVYRAAGAAQCSYTCFRVAQKKSPPVTKQRGRRLKGCLPTREECEKRIREETQMLDTLTGDMRRKCITRKRYWMKMLEEIEIDESERKNAGHG